ncbi:MAG: tRNA glutamyl-Q(34) synthetase GluQRS [Pseudomonadota bacterium]
MPEPSALPYVGRFAPSPTGPLHFGSAVAAIASFLDARHHHGEWLVRIDDLDPPREQAGAAEIIIDTLKACGLEPDGRIVYQSERHELYQSALATLAEKQLLYPCGCTRKEVGQSTYPGTCSNGLPAGKQARSTRFRVSRDPICFLDAGYGPQREVLAESVGDFNLVRADGLFAYHLAVVVDDADQGITHITRGVDLLPSTARQIALQQALNYPTPHYRHFPVVCDAAGNKLSKQTGAAAVDCTDPKLIWQRALRFLNQPTPKELSKSLEHLIQFAIENWRPAKIESIGH